MKRAHGGASDKSVLDFSSNVNPLGPPDGVLRVLAQSGELVFAYPVPDADEFCQAVARHLSVPRECILAGNGATDLIYLITRLLSGGRARVITPAFTEYEDACEAAEIPVNDGDHDVTFLANPTSPAGQLFSAEEILENPGPLIVDESFIDFAGEEFSLASKAASDPRLIVLRSLTKFYAIPGLRLGYIVAPPETVLRLKSLQPPWSVTALAIAAGVAALEDHNYAERTRKLVPELRENLSSSLKSLDLAPMASAVNFILCRVPDAALLCRELLEFGIAARNCDSFTGLEKNRFVRFAVRGHEDNTRLLAALKEIVETCRITR